MKKIYAISTAVLLGISGAAAQSFHFLSGGQMYGGFMPQAISPDGQYVGGSTFVGAMFMSEWQQPNANLIFIQGQSESVYENYGAEIRGINNQGIGVGYDDRGGVVVDFNQGTYNLAYPIGGNVKDVIFESITDDGSIIVGTIGVDDYTYYACYWENGELKYLPIPTEEELGFKIFGSRAIGVSGDGSVIVGRLNPNFPTYPMVIWYRQADGSYVCDPVCKEWYTNDMSKNPENKMFGLFQPLALNHNGTKVAMKVIYAITDSKDKLFDTTLIAVYDIPTNTINVSIPNGSNYISPYQAPDVFKNGISDDGTVVGYLINEIGDRKSFIIYPSEDLQPMLLADVFPELEEIAELDDNGDNIVSSITPDGKYIAGTAWSNTVMAYQGFIIETGYEAGVESIGMDLDGKTRIYNLQGQKVTNPVKGNLYIINGKKVIY